MNWLEVGASIAEIGTAVVAIIGASLYAITLRQKRIKLEEYLKGEKDNKPLGPDDNGRRTIQHLIAYLKMTEQDVLNAAWRSKKIIPQPRVNKTTHIVEGIYLEYRP